LAGGNGDEDYDELEKTRLMVAKGNGGWRLQ